MPTHRRPAHRRPVTRRGPVALGAAVLAIGATITAAMLVDPDVSGTANASDTAPGPPPPAVPTPSSTTVPDAEPTIDPVADTLVDEPSSPYDRDAAFIQLMVLAGYPQDPGTTTFMDTSVTSICADLAAGRTGVDILEEVADSTDGMGWSDEQSDGLVYIGVASQCSAYSYLLP
ncbi:MAG: hypothetical protein WBA00_13175 [Rhodococcus sp. (in: high G+C Gram-positive bacteria)]